MVTLFAGPIGCDPSVSRFDLDSAQAKVDEQQGRLAKVEQQLEDARKEMKELQAFGGPEHQSKLRAAATLREEKTQLTALKSDLDARLDKFEKGAARLRESLEKMKKEEAQQPPPPKQP